MKHIILRCEDGASPSAKVAPLWEGAKLAHLQQLAQAGAAGVIRHTGRAKALDRFSVHRALLGLDGKAPEAAPARCYAATAGVQLAPEETAWCCELVTQQDGKISDPTAGNIPTKEGEILVQAINHQLGSETKRWEVGNGSHHLLITHDEVFATDDPQVVRPPELLAGQRWNRCLPKGALGHAVNLLIEQAMELLEDHPINRVRVDLGENPANMIWLWGPARGPIRKTFRERTGLSGAVLSHSFPMRGFAQSLGLGWKEAPAALDEPAFHRLLKSTTALLEHDDLVYVHLRVDSADPVVRLCTMERIDQVFLKSLTEHLPHDGSWRLLAAIDDRTNTGVPFVAIGKGLPQQPIAHLNAHSFAESPLTFDVRDGLFTWFTRTHEG